MLLGQLVSIAVQSDSGYDSSLDPVDASDIGDVFLRVLTGCRHRASLFLYFIYCRNVVDTLCSKTTILV